MGGGSARRVELFSAAPLEMERDLAPQDRGPVGASRWHGHLSEPRRALQCVLDLDVDLAEELDAPILRATRAAATAFTFECEPGRLAVPDWLAATATGPRAAHP